MVSMSKYSVYACVLLLGYQEWNIICNISLRKFCLYHKEFNYKVCIDSTNNFKNQSSAFKFSVKLGNTFFIIIDLKIMC